MCETPLRGTRGKVLRQAGSHRFTIEVVSAPIPGRDVRATIDIGLQGELQQMFEHMQVPSNGAKISRRPKLAMHGAAGRDRCEKSGNVRALASYPDYDVNDLQRNFEAIAGNEDESAADEPRHA
jgi:cell division protein FtsI/penicillin-binding protein 2